MHSVAIQQGIRNRSISGARGANRVIGRNRIENRGPDSGHRAETPTQMRGRDDRSGHGERRHGRDDGIGRNATVTRDTREVNAAAAKTMASAMTPATPPVSASRATTMAGITNRAIAKARSG